MKKVVLLSAIGVFFISSAFTNPQPSQVQQLTKVTVAGDFSFLRAHRQGSGITLTWGMASNSNLIGFDIEKTMEDPNDPYSVWTPVTNITGSDARSFKYTDGNVLPGTSNYRVIAWYADGRSSTSEIISVKINAR
jgi:hypothetical protein